MSAPRAPWWLYLVAASFLGFFTLEIYTNIWGPVWIGFRSDYNNGSMLLREVSPDEAGARAGLRRGDRIVALEGISIHGEKDFYRAHANLEPGRPIPMEIERKGKQMELSVTLRRGSVRDLDWRKWEVIGGELFTLILALVIAFRRPYDPIARMGAWGLASLVVAMLSPPVMAGPRPGGTCPRRWGFCCGLRRSAVAWLLGSVSRSTPCFRASYFALAGRGG